MKTQVMNRNLIVSILAVLMLTYSIQGISYAQETPDTIVEFADTNLAKAVREKLGLPTGDGTDLLKIPKAELEKLTTLEAEDKEIVDLTGLEHATQLTKLDLTGNKISDITSLTQLTQLTELRLKDNQIRDVSPLIDLIHLEALYLADNPITDKSPLKVLLDKAPGLGIDISVYDYIQGPWLWMIAPGSDIDTDYLAVQSEGAITEAQVAQNGVNVGDTLDELQWTSKSIYPSTRCGWILCASDNVQHVVNAAGLSTVQNLSHHTAYAFINIVSPRDQNNVRMGVGSDDSVKVWLNGTVVFREEDSRRTTGIQDRFDTNLKAGNNLLLVKVSEYSGEWGMFFKIYTEFETSIYMVDELPSITTTDATVSVSPASVASPAVGDQLAVSLNITGSEAVAGYQATVQFDDTALRYVSSENGDFLPAGAFFAPPIVEKNLVKLNAVSLAGETNGNGTLATLTFEVIAVKASTLTLSDVLLTDSDGEAFVPTVENAQITESTQLKGDVNSDGIVNIQDLVLVAGKLGQTGTNSADINGDGQINIQDLVLVAGALGTTAAAPSLHPQALEMLTATEIKQWLSEVQQFDLTDTMSQRGILFLQQLLTKLTPKETTLLANYPNPFNPETWIPYHLAKDADVTLHIYAVNGTLVRTLTLGHQAAGMYQNRSRAAYWDGRNEFGEKVASGLYFYTLTAGDFSATRKMLIQK